MADGLEIESFLNKPEWTQACRNRLKEYGNVPIANLTVSRTPIAGAIDKLLGLLGFGSWGQIKKNNSFDSFYHLYLIVELANGKRVALEKNAQVNITNYVESDRAKAEMQSVDITPERLPQGLTLNKMLLRTWKKVGDNRFFNYSGFNLNGAGNCQRFVADCLSFNYIMTLRTRQFIEQDIEQVSGSYPWFSKLIAQKITDLGGWLEKTGEDVGAFFGIRFKKGGKVFSSDILKKNGRNQRFVPAGNRIVYRRNTFQTRGSSFGFRSSTSSS